MTRGLVIPLTAEQRVARMRYLAGELPLDQVAGVDLSTPVPTGYPVVQDDHVGTSTPVLCPPIYYLLKDYNGGKNPRARDPADRWRKPGGRNWNRTCDCMGGAAWTAGFDRYQPDRFGHLYKGWINTDSMRMDAALSRPRCFQRLDRPEPGCFVVFASGAAGHRVGHIGGVDRVPAEYAPAEREWWDQLGVVDVADRGAQRANKRTTGRVWWRTNAWFIVSTMIP